jgi:hypothetical protein
VLQSHTATQQWQSFELRMRRRRVERCLLRASVAIEAGVLEDAREAIDEVRRLDPTEPGLEPLAAQLADAENPETVEHSPLAQAPPRRVQQAALPLPAPAPQSAPAGHHRFAAAAVLLACSVAAGWWWMSTSGTALPVHLASTTASFADRPVADAPQDPSVKVSETSVAAPTSAEPPRSGDEPLATSGMAAIEGDRAQPEVRTGGDTELPGSPVEVNASARITPPEPVQASPVSPSSERPALAESRNSAVVLPPVTDASPAAPPPPVTPARLEPLTGLPETPPASPRVVTGAENISTPEAAARSATALTTLPPAPAPEPAPARPEEQSVRAALGRYESAYNRLDAAAAASVWPGVNQRALASAFEGLSAQSISLGGCNIRVNGATAHAECSGNARWTPKVGGGTQSAQRQWRFALHNSGGNWVISQATTR